MNIQIVIFILFWGVCIRCLYVNFLSPKKKVQAKVVDKQRIVSHSVSRTSAKKYSVKYAVTFLINNKKETFYVTELGFDGYKLNQKGTLIYRGSRIINFIC